MALPGLDAFFTLPAAQRGPLLVEGIRASHRYHFDRNAAYRRTVRARGMGEEVGPERFQRLLRPAALTFKSYVETIGPFPQDDPGASSRGWAISSRSRCRRIAGALCGDGT